MGVPGATERVARAPQADGLWAAGGAVIIPFLIRFEVGFCRLLHFPVPRCRRQRAMGPGGETLGLTRRRIDLRQPK